MNFSHHESCPECGSKDNVGVWEDGHKHCFGCGYHSGLGGLGTTSLRERFERFNTVAQKQQQEDGGKSRSVFLDPDDLDMDLPDVARAWLAQYGITDQEIRRLSIGYSKKNRRLVLPLLDKYGNVLVYQQRRLFDDDPKPKYLTTGGVDGVVWFPMELDKYPKQDTVVVVEDFVSAVKVGRLIPCMPLFGTNIPPKTLRILQERFEKLVVWLDPDKKKEALQAAVRVSVLFPRGATTCWSTSDPKELSMKEIQELLDRSLSE